MTVPHIRDNRWRKTTFSETQGACIEVHPDGALRDSKNPSGPVLLLPAAGLVTFAKGVTTTR